MVKKVARRIKRAHLNKTQVLYLVKLRYGSETNFDTDDIASYPEVAKRSGVAVSTVRDNIIRFHRNGNKFVKYKILGRKSTIPLELQKAMVEPEVLIAMRFLPLRTRAERHSKQFGVKVTLVQLRAIYKKHKVRFRQPKLTSRLPDWKEEELIPKRILFAEKMLRMRERGRHIIYADESTFLATARPGKTWMAGVRMDVEKNHP